MRAVPVDFPLIEVVVDFLGVGGWDVVCRAPDFACGGCFGFQVGELEVYVNLAVLDNGAERGHTGSFKVSQKVRSITVTTRPGCSGVPR